MSSFAAGEAGDSEPAEEGRRRFRRREGWPAGEGGQEEEEEAAEEAALGGQVRLQRQVGRGRRRGEHTQTYYQLLCQSLAG